MLCRTSPFISRLTSRQQFHFPLRIPLVNSSARFIFLSRSTTLGDGCKWPNISHQNALFAVKCFVCPSSRSTQQRRLHEIVHRNDANQLIYSVDVQHTIRKNSFQIFNRPSGKRRTWSWGDEVKSIRWLRHEEFPVGRKRSDHNGERYANMTNVSFAIWNG